MAGSPGAGKTEFSKHLITDANFDVSCKNIERSLNKRRHTHIFYVYQEPKIAWEFTKAREAMEGRRVPMETFVDAFFKAKENVERIMEEFGKNIKLFLVEKKL